MTESETLVLGAVAYDPKVVTIWEGFRQYFAEHGLNFDYVLFSNYERQVQALFAGLIDVAWNSPLAWVQSQRIAAATGQSVEAVCMRDTDRDLRSVILVRAHAGVKQLGDLKGKRVAVGAADSPQATLIPLGSLAFHGLEPRKDFEVVGFDRLPGMHGDHVGGEREAVQALLRGEVDAACIIESNLQLFTRERSLPAGAVRVLAHTSAYDHCNFTVLSRTASRLVVARFRKLLLGMSYEDRNVRTLLDLEGLRRWVPGRTSGYAELEAAVDRFGTIESFVNETAARYK